MFDVVIQLGAILSVVVYFRKRLIPSGRNYLSENHRIFDLWKKTIVGVIPALGIGFVAGKYIQERMFNTTVVGLALIVGGIILVYIEKRKPMNRISSFSEPNKLVHNYQVSRRGNGEKFDNPFYNS